MSKDKIKENKLDYLRAAKDFEPRWRAYWAATGVLNAKNPPSEKDKYVVLDFFPYPSGIGLHVGHPLGYIATDVVARMKRMQGYNVLHSMGFDSFGLPAEQFAIQTNQHPAVTTQENVDNMLTQLRVLGLGHDETRRFCTSDSSYYKWTQWIFSLLRDSVWDPLGMSKFGNALGKAISVDEAKELLRSGVRHVEAQSRLIVAPNTEGSVIAVEGDLDKIIDANRLAVLSEQIVNWCPQLGTVLANEEVSSEGRSERGDHPVFKRALRQWVLRITPYAERLVADLDGLDWPRGIVEMQKNWIGVSRGTEITFRVEGSEPLVVYTTRVETIFGVTYLAISKDHPLAQSKGADQGTKEPVAIAIHPITDEPIPIFVAHYVVADYGTGAVMGVPAHDERDFRFAAERKDVRIVPVVEPSPSWLAQHCLEAVALDYEKRLEKYVHDCASFDSAFVEQGKILSFAPNPPELWGKTTLEATEIILTILESKGLGAERRATKLRDWIFSRQRYWGEPFPIVYGEDGAPYLLAESELPVVLPELRDFSPETSDSSDAPVRMPLDKAIEWVNVWGIVDERARVTLVDPSHPGAKPFRRETNTMPNWAGSCWYYLRYFDPHNKDCFVSAECESYWSGPANTIGAVDLYVGGAEHAVLHLLYARFWHKVLFDRGYVHTPEPFQRLFSQGMITADAYQDSRGFYVAPDDVELREIEGNTVAVERATGTYLKIIAGKMGKRYKNGVPPEEVAARHSVDSYRLYMMFLGPLDGTTSWNEGPMSGTDRFLNQVFRLAHAPLTNTVPRELAILANQTIRDVTESIEQLKFNTAVSALMIFSNALARYFESSGGVPGELLEKLILLLAPFAPHLAEELTSFGEVGKMPKEQTVFKKVWPVPNSNLLIDDEVDLVVQVNGKTRGKTRADRNDSDEDIKGKAFKSISTSNSLAGQNIIKSIIHRNDKSILINFVTKPI